MLSFLLTPLKWLLAPVGALAVYAYFVVTTPVAKANERWQTRPACAAAFTVFQFSSTNIKFNNGPWQACDCLITALERGLGEQNAVRALEMMRQATVAHYTGQPRPRLAEETEMKERIGRLPSAKACLA